MSGDSQATVSSLHRIQTRLLGLGIATSLLFVLGGVWNPQQFFRSYLFGFLFWLGVALGSLALVMLHNLTSGAWGIMIRRLLEAGFATLPWMALLFIPLLFGLRSIYRWTAAAEISAEQAHYLNIPFFVLRAGLYFGVWVWLARRLLRLSEQQAHSEPSVRLQQMRLLSGPGLVLYGLTVSFAAFDWLMSLDPAWSSSIFGMLVIAGQVLSAMALVIPSLAWLSSAPALSKSLQPRHFHDLGKLLLTWVMLWAYLAYSQLVIIWSGNLTPEIPWYVRRWSGGWQWVGVALIVFYFGLPFALLLSREFKRSASALALLSLFLFAMQAVDLFWLIAPEFSPGRFRIHWLDLAALLAIGCLWAARFLSHLRGRGLLPVADPQMAEALRPEHEGAL